MEFLSQYIRAAGLKVENDVQIGGRQRPADLLITRWTGLLPLAGDVVVTHPLAPSLGLSSAAAAAAVRNKVTRKKAKYAELVAVHNLELAPLAFCTFGGLGEDCLSPLSLCSWPATTALVHSWVQSAPTCVTPPLSPSCSRAVFGGQGLGRVFSVPFYPALACSNYPRPLLDTFAFPSLKRCVSLVQVHTPVSGTHFVDGPSSFFFGPAQHLPALSCGARTHCTWLHRVWTSTVVSTLLPREHCCRIVLSGRGGGENLGCENPLSMQ